MKKIPVITLRWAKGTNYAMSAGKILNGLTIAMKPGTRFNVKWDDCITSKYYKTSDGQVYSTETGPGKVWIYAPELSSMNMSKWTYLGDNALSLIVAEAKLVSEGLLEPEDKRSFYPSPDALHTKWSG